METIDAECKACEYKWTTKSQMALVSCPCCGNKVRIRLVVNEKEVQDNGANDEL